MNNIERNIYIPEYNPQKYKKASKVIKAISIIFLIIMVLGITIILLKNFLDSNSFLVNINGVSQKNWELIIIMLAIVISVFGLTSLFLFVLYIRLKQVNAIFSESDENKRLEMHLKFDSQAKAAAKAYAVYSTVNLASNVKTNK